MIIIAGKEGRIVFKKSLRLFFVLVAPLSARVWTDSSSVSIKVFYEEINSGSSFNTFSA
jgi:hypothetical protein